MPQIFTITSAATKYSARTHIGPFEAKNGSLISVEPSSESSFSLRNLDWCFSRGVCILSYTHRALSSKRAPVYIYFGRQPILRLRLCKQKSESVAHFFFQYILYKSRDHEIIFHASRYTRVVAIAPLFRCDCGKNYFVECNGQIYFNINEVLIFPDL